MRDSPAAVARHVSNHFCSSKGVVNKDDILQAEPIQHSSKIIGEGVEIVAAARVIGARMTAPVKGHAAPSPLGKVHHRSVPPIGGEPPGRYEDDEAAGAPIAKMDHGSIAGLDHRGGARSGNLGLCGLHCYASAGKG